MFNPELLQRLKAYTDSKIESRSAANLMEDDMLLAKDVFEENTSIFVNVHTLRSNSPNRELHGHDFFEMTYVVRGTCIQTIDNGEPEIFTPGIFCIMNPNARHNLYVEHEEDLAINILLKQSLFNSTFWSMLEQKRDLGRFFMSYFVSQNATSDYLKYDTNQSPEVEASLEKICREYLDRRPYSSTIIRCMLIIFFTEVVRSSELLLAQWQFEDQAAARIMDIFQYLSRNYATATLASTAAHFHYHPNYLSAFIRKHTGKTFRQILNDIKFAEANYYLTNTSMPIKDVSEKLGFTQLCNFYEFVRKNFHTTPYHLRQVLAAQEATER